MPFDEFSFARTSIRQYHAIMAISALKPTRIQLPWPDPPTLLPLVVQIIRLVPGSEGASRPFSVTQLRIPNASSFPIAALRKTPRDLLTRAALRRSRFPGLGCPWFDSGPSRIRGKDRGEAAGRGHHPGIPASRNASATRAYKSVWLFDCSARWETDLK